MWSEGDRVVLCGLIIIAHALASAKFEHFYKQKGCKRR